MATPPRGSIAEPTDTFDRDLDLTPRRPRHRSRGDLPPQFYQRLVANPFLSVFILVEGCAVVAGVGQWLEIRPASLVVPFLVLVIPVLATLQYHCLDCGQTGWLFRWQRHTCDRVRERREASRPRYLRGPTVGVQVGLWMILGGFTMLYLAIQAIDNGRR